MYAVDIGITSEDYLNVSSNINPSFATAPEAMIGVAFKRRCHPTRSTRPAWRYQGTFGGATAGPSPGVAGMAISGYPGGTSSSIFAPLAGLAISGYPGGADRGAISCRGGPGDQRRLRRDHLSHLLTRRGHGDQRAPSSATAGPSPGVAGMAISGGCGGAVFPGIISPVAGLAISGYPGGERTAGPAPGVAGMAISGSGAASPGPSLLCLRA